MASACGWFMSSAAASISSVVVRPLPHSCAIRRNGALVMPAIGARRASARISTGPIFMPTVYRLERLLVDDAALHDEAQLVLALEDAQVLQRIAVDCDQVGVLARLYAADLPLHPEQLRVDPRCGEQHLHGLHDLT